jgi:hypothetical protein
MNIHEKKKKKESNPLNIQIEEVSFINIKESDINPQEMSNKDFERLVENLRRDKVLTSAPLLMRQGEGEKLLCISGHHRIRAAIKAGIEKAYCIVVDKVDDSTRIRLQLAHNDIHGNPREDIVAILQNKLNEIDIALVDYKDIEATAKTINQKNLSVPEFSYINICLLEESRDRFVNMLMAIDPEKTESFIIEKKEYERLKDLLTLAFKKGFKSPGQAIGKFMDIVEEHLEEIQRDGS